MNHLTFYFLYTETNPLDYVYRCLNCQIRLMDENETEAQYLLRYVSASWKGEWLYHVIWHIMM